MMEHEPSLYERDLDRCANGTPKPEARDDDFQEQKKQRQQQQAQQQQQAEQEKRKPHEPQSAAIIDTAAGRD